MKTLIHTIILLLCTPMLLSAQLYIAGGTIKVSPGALLHSSGDITNTGTGTLTNEGTLSTPGNLTAVLVKAVQEQQIIIENGAQRMEELESMSAEQQAEIQKLQSQLSEMDALKDRMARLEAVLFSNDATTSKTTEK